MTMRVTGLLTAVISRSEEWVPAIIGVASARPASNLAWLLAVCSLVLAVSPRGEPSGCDAPGWPLPKKSSCARVTTQHTDGSVVWAVVCEGQLTARRKKGAFLWSTSRKAEISEILPKQPLDVDDSDRLQRRTDMAQLPSG